MDDSQVLLQVLNNIVQRNAKRIQDHEVEIANYMTTLVRLEARVAALEEKNEEYLSQLENRSETGENKK